MNISQYSPTTFDCYIWQHLTEAENKPTLASAVGEIQAWVQAAEEPSPSKPVQKVAGGCITCPLGKFVSSVDRTERFIMMKSVKENVCIFAWGRKSIGIENGVGFGAYIPVSAVKEVSLKRMLDALEKTYAGAQSGKIKINVFGGYGCDDKIIKCVALLLERRGFRNVNVGNVLKEHQGNVTMWYCGMDLVSGRFVSHSVTGTEECVREDNKGLEVDKTFQVTQLE